MPKINFNFSGWVSGAEIDKVVVTTTGKTKDVSKEDAESVSAKLESGQYSIPALSDHLYTGKCEFDITDFEPAD